MRDWIEKLARELETSFPYSLNTYCVQDNMYVQTDLLSDEHKILVTIFEKTSSPNAPTRKKYESFITLSMEEVRLIEEAVKVRNSGDEEEIINYIVNKL